MHVRVDVTRQNEFAFAIDHARKGWPYLLAYSGNAIAININVGVCGWIANFISSGIDQRCASVSSFLPPEPLLRDRLRYNRGYAVANKIRRQQSGKAPQQARQEPPREARTLSRSQ